MSNSGLLFEVLEWSNMSSSKLLFEVLEWSNMSNSELLFEVLEWSQPTVKTCCSTLTLQTTVFC
jgi:hypothetical protein